MEKKYTDLGFAKLDKDRVRRRGNSEAVFCECKTSEQLVDIFKSFNADGQNVIGTRASKEQYEDLKKVFENIEYNEKGRTLKLITSPVERVGEVAICTGGTGDIPVAEEAADAAEFYGSNVKKYYDIGVAGIHRLFVILMSCVAKLMTVKKTEVYEK